MDRLVRTLYSLYITDSFLKEFGFINIFKDFYLKNSVLHFFINEVTIKYFSINKLLNNELYKSKINYTININKINKIKQ